MGEGAGIYYLNLALLLRGASLFLSSFMTCFYGRSFKYDSVFMIPLHIHL